MKLPPLCIGQALQLKRQGKASFQIDETTLIRLWTEPDKNQGKMLLRSKIELGAYHKLEMSLGMSGLMSMDAGAPEIATHVFMTYQALFYAMPEMVKGLGSVMCALQEHAMPDDEDSP